MEKDKDDSLPKIKKRYEIVRKDLFEMHEIAGKALKKTVEDDGGSSAIVSNEVSELSEISVMAKEQDTEKERSKSVGKNESRPVEGSTGSSDTLKDTGKNTFGDYTAMDMDQLVAVLRKLIKNEPVQHLKPDVEAIKKEFNRQYSELQHQKKERFLAEGGEEVDFQYNNPVKTLFNSMLYDYKEKKNAYHREQERRLNKNLVIRRELIEELKGLINSEEHMNTTFRHFQDIQKRWKDAGAVPRAKNDDLWRTYHHHVEIFYDYLHLNKELRDLDFKHNLEEKLKLIQNAEDLVYESDINKAFRRLQVLHKVWKEELGPVAREYREEIWKRFSTATQNVHDKRHEYFESLEKNLVEKKAVIRAIEEVTTKEVTSFDQWREKVNTVKQLHAKFFDIGKVSRSKSKKVWKAFRDARQKFYKSKKTFFKEQKKLFRSNLAEKQRIVERAESLKNSDDWEATAILLKKMQQEWQNTGYVPRKYSNELWTRFKNACSHYFERYRQHHKSQNNVSLIAYERAKKMLEQLREFKPTGDTDNDTKTLKEFVRQWKEIKDIPVEKRYLLTKFDRLLIRYLDRTAIDRKAIEFVPYKNLQSKNTVGQKRTRATDKEIIYTHRKIDEIGKEIQQLENNLNFISRASAKNPMVIEVHKKIDAQRESLAAWKTKLHHLKQLGSN